MSKTASKELSELLKKNGSKGGKSTLKKFGPKHFAKISKKGLKARLAKKQAAK